MISIDQDTRDALDRLIFVASCSSGQSSYVADFLLAWWNASENGGFDPMSFKSLDDKLVADILRVIIWISRNNCFPDEIGYGDSFESLWRQWRSKK